MNTPPGGAFLFRKASNYASGTTVQTEGSTGTILLDYAVPAGKELWVKSTAINPNTGAVSVGNFAYKAGQNDMGPTFTCAAIQDDDFGYHMILRQGQHFQILLWSNNGTSVGAEVMLKGKLYQDGTFDRVWKEL